jgi:membrane-bound serine protease (ClpP class)
MKVELRMNLVKLLSIALVLVVICAPATSRRLQLCAAGRAQEAADRVATDAPPATQAAENIPGTEAGKDEAGKDEAGKDEAAKDAAGKDEAGKDAAAQDAASEVAAKVNAGEEDAAQAGAAQAGAGHAAAGQADVVLEQTFHRALLIDVRGAIFENLKQYLIGRINAAQRAKVDLIILRVTSPGGELDASLELARKLSAINWATTVAFVPEEAYSGAAILALGCDRIYMRPRALIGDAGPIHFHGGFFEHADEKVVSALAVAMHQLAAAKKRPGAVAEAMVDRTLIVHEATDKDTGARTFLTAAETQVRRNQDDYIIGPAIPESGQNRFLTVGGTRAVELMIAEGTFDSEQQLLGALHIDQLSETRRTWVDNVVFTLNRPFVSGLLLLIGLIGLYVEFSVPGISVAALVSLSCFALFFWSHALGGTSGWLEVMLFALGVSCLGIELFILPGFGLFGLTGAVMIVLSLVMASQDFLLPQSTVQWATLRNNLLIVLGAMASLVVALIIQVMFFDSIPGLGRIRLEAPDSDYGPPEASVGLASAPAGFIALPQVGARGTADSVLRPAGKVRFVDHLVDVVTEGDFLDPGTEVEVVKREGNRVIVRRMS